MPRLLSLLLSLVIASSGSAVSMAWTPIGNPGNACDIQSQGCFGAVNYSYSIGTYEVTNAQYAEFLNAKAASDPHSLYNPNMGSSATFFYGGITQSGSFGSFSYATIAGREDMPVNWVSFSDVLRFANWMNNGQGSGDTENGAYTITSQGILANSITRNAGATVVLSNEDEWYKAAYYDPNTASYFDYPAGSDSQTVCSQATSAANRANCDNTVGDLTPKGSYTGSMSPYGTFDQGGNIYEWNETIDVGTRRVVRGGSFFSSASTDSMAAASRENLIPTSSPPYFGFRLALVPEPGTGVLVALGLVAFASRRRIL